MLVLYCQSKYWQSLEDEYLQSYTEGMKEEWEKGKELVDHFFGDLKMEVMVKFIEKKKKS